MTKLIFGRDVQGYNAYAPTFSKDKISATLATGGNASFTVPSNFENWIIAFSYTPGSEFWVSVNGTAAGPSGGTFTSTDSQCLPGALTVLAADVINVINVSAGTADVGVVMYAI